jgi:hypothetical protein
MHDRNTIIYGKIIIKILKQNLKHCKQLRKLYLQTEKVKKKMLQAINQRPL